MNKSIKAKEKKWIVKSDASREELEACGKIASTLGINPIIARLLYNRGYKDALSAKSFLYMETEVLSDPYQLKDIKPAAERIIGALNKGEKITIYGDYDVDGVTAVCTIYLYLKSKGANIDYYIPNRSGEGYGVSSSAIDALKNSGTSLIITVDTGITANAEVDYAKSIGVDFIVTDHHECHAELPAAVAVINPHRPDCKYPFKELAGVGVVFKLVCAYEERINGKSRIKAATKIFSEYSDLVAIGTIADVMPIKCENRIIVSHGLHMIETSARLGISALIDSALTKGEHPSPAGKKKRRVKITSGYIGYTLAPRINAAGRIRSASIAVELFLAKDEATASMIAEELCQANRERQAEENSIMKEAYTMIEGIDIDKTPVIVLDADDWHHGVIGIVSSRITEKYCRPSILVSFEGGSAHEHSADDVGKGSGRSVKGMNLVDALCYCDDLLVKFGGHELAAGLSVKRGNLDAFKAKINEYALLNLKPSDMVPTFESDAEINFSDVNISLAEQLRILEPYGVGNPIPTFTMTNLVVAEMVGISDGKHTKLTLSNGKSTVTAMFFSNSPDSLGIYVGDKVDVLFNIDINEYIGKKSVQLIVKDLKISKEQSDSFRCEYSRFEEVRGGAAFNKEENIYPSRDDFAAVYKFISASVRSGVDTISHRDICARVSRNFATEISYVKLKFIIMVMMEMNIITIEEVSDELYHFVLHYTSSKADLEKSNILRRLRSQLARG